MTGNLLWLPSPPEAAPPFLRARALLDDGSYLGYTDVRRFGTWRVAEDGAEALLAGKLGPEPLGDWTAADLARALGGQQGAREGGAARPARGRRRRQHLRGRGALGRPHPSAPRPPDGSPAPAWRACTTPCARPCRRASTPRAPRSATSARPTAATAPPRSASPPTAAEASPASAAARPLRRTVIAQRGTVYCPHCQRF